MGILERMQRLTKGEPEQEEPIKNAEAGDLITGYINSVIRKQDNKKGGFGFITSEALPYERIFFHWTGLRQDTLRFPELKKRMKVEFELKYDKFRQDSPWSAIKIRVLGINKEK